MGEHPDIRYDSATGRYHATFNPASEPASDAVVSSISEVVGTDPDKLASIEAVVDPIVFDALVRRRRRPIQISFVHHEHDVTVDTGGEIWIQPSSEDEREAYEFSFDTDESPSQAVIRAIEAVKDAESTDVTPLYEFIDPDALDAMFDTTVEGREQDVLVSFRMDKWEIEVTSDGRVEIRSVTAVD